MPVYDRCAGQGVCLSPAPRPVARQGGARVPTYLAIGQLLIAVALIAAILLQVQGGGLGGIFGQPDAVYRTRRGVERTLFRLTLVLASVFVVLAMVIVVSS